MVKSVHRKQVWQEKSRHIWFLIHYDRDEECATHPSAATERSRNQRRALDWRQTVGSDSILVIFKAKSLDEITKG